MSARDDAVRILKNYFRAAGYSPADMLAENDFAAEMELLVDSIIAAAVKISREEVQEVTAPVESGSYGVRLLMFKKGESIVHGKLKSVEDVARFAFTRWYSGFMECGTPKVYSDSAGYVAVYNPLQHVFCWFGWQPDEGWYITGSTDSLPEDATPIFWDGEPCTMNGEELEKPF
jgi:hypothetical protein